MEVGVGRVRRLTDRPAPAGTCVGPAQTLNRKRLNPCGGWRKMRVLGRNCADGGGGREGVIMGGLPKAADHESCPKRAEGANVSGGRGNVRLGILGQCRTATSSRRRVDRGPPLWGRPGSTSDTLGSWLRSKRGGEPVRGGRPGSAPPPTPLDEGLAAGEPRGVVRARRRQRHREGRVPRAVRPGRSGSSGLPPRPPAGPAHLRLPHRNALLPPDPAVVL